MAVTVALFAIAPNLVPGAISLFGVVLALLALALSLFSINKNGKKYYRTTGVIVIGNVLLINDALRLWEPLPMPLNIRLSLYGLVLVMVVICASIAYRLNRAARNPDKSANLSPPPASPLR
ncbi:hypothetical protein D3871_25440 [Noviherbaspirillum saxi]|uniref:Uncharacterized protein n=1 Tax=Noviherbaspirillum saxi TaxID=2320863 RepID=A0A3A3FHZ1_9BURK|nr:hypothetical protein D3871_25440 [Noviherbaspirillum saxi]